MISPIHKQFSNNPKGFEAFFLWINKSKKEVYTCLEATGIYSFDLAQYLSHKKINVMVVNPIITHAFFKMELNRNKTDKADAQLIARYCEHVVVTGGYEKKSYQPKGRRQSEYKSYADSAAAFLKKNGINQSDITSLPTPDSAQNRTF